MFEAQPEGGNVSNFQCYKGFRAGFTEDVNLDFKKKFIHDLNMYILRDLQIESGILLFHNSFDCSIDDAQVELQLQLIDMQENDLLKKRIC